jgi:hypothetical protein
MTGVDETQGMYHLRNNKWRAYAIDSKALATLEDKFESIQLGKPPIGNRDPFN